MLPIGLNHMTVPNMSTRDMLQTADALNFAGIELRNDLPTALFDGADPRGIREAAQDHDLQIFVLAEVYAFNDDNDDARTHVIKLAHQAQACGA